MENASKALLIGASVLISLMVISLIVYLYTSFGGTSAQIAQTIDENQIAQFNSQFTTYIGKTNVTIYDIVSMANLATQNNKNYGFEKQQTSTGNDNYISVELQGKGAIEYGVNTSEDVIKDAYDTLILQQLNSIDASTNLTYYHVQVEISDVTKRVYRVICTKR